MKRFNFLVAVSKEYESRFRILETSIKKFEPGSSVEKLLLEGPSNCSYIEGLPKLRFEKALEILEKGSDHVVIIGADCVLYDQMIYVKSLLYEEKYDIILSSHIVYPPSEGINNYYKTGLINGDFLIFKNTENSKSILKWLISQPIKDDICNGMFFEQTLLSSLPFISFGVYIIQHPEYNVAWFNLHERSIDTVVMFHFSGYEKGMLPRLSKHSPIEVTGKLLDLLKEYDDQL